MAVPKIAKHVRWASILLMTVVGAAPLVLYWLLLGRIPAVTPREARQIMADQATSTAIVDVRTAEEYGVGHITGTQHWPWEEIAALGSVDTVPDELKGKRLLLLCSGGIRSAIATKQLRALGIADVSNVRGGIQAWVSGCSPDGERFCSFQTASGETHSAPFRESSLFEQFVVVATGFFVKPLYMLLSLLWAILLWRQRADDLTAFRWAMLCFFVGEAFCALNYTVYHDRSFLAEYLHSYGMVACFGLTTFALLEGLDHRLIKFSDPEARCAALSLCHRCFKHADAPCGFMRAFQYLIPAVAILSFMPLVAEPIPVSYYTKIFVTLYNWSHAEIYQIFEFRYLPVAALLLLITSLVLLKSRIDKPVLWSKIFFSSGMGALEFSFFRLFLLQVYRNNLNWFAAWEELMELLFILACGLVLWIFRRGLFAPSEAAAIEQPTPG